MTLFFFSFQLLSCSCFIPHLIKYSPPHFHPRSLSYALFPLSLNVFFICSLLHSPPLLDNCLFNFSLLLLLLLLLFLLSYTNPSSHSQFANTNLKNCLSILPCYTVCFSDLLDVCIMLLCIQNTEHFLSSSLFNCNYSLLCIVAFFVVVRMHW